MAGRMYCPFYLCQPIRSCPSHLTRLVLCAGTLWWALPLVWVWGQVARTTSTSAHSRALRGPLGRVLVGHSGHTSI